MRKIFNINYLTLICLILGYSFKIEAGHLKFAKRGACNFFLCFCIGEESEESEESQDEVALSDDLDCSSSSIITLSTTTEESTGIQTSEEFKEFDFEKFNQQVNRELEYNKKRLNDMGVCIFKNHHTGSETSSVSTTSSSSSEEDFETKTTANIERDEMPRTRTRDGFLSPNLEKKLRKRSKWKKPQKKN